MSNESRREEQRKCDFARARRVDALLVESEEKAKRLETELDAAKSHVKTLRTTLEAAEQYLVERGVEVRGIIGRTKILPMIREALEETK